MIIIFDNACFIKPDAVFDRNDNKNCIAPIFRRTFYITDFRKATLNYCALGFGHVWLNGERIDNHVFGTDESAYHKTLWYNTADITAGLRKGKNVIAVLCGNGFFNEIFRTSWDFDKARWRDNPKLILSLDIDGETVLASDGSWKCFTCGPIVYNQIRGGEIYDARLDGDYFGLSYDDSSWQYAKEDDNPPGGVFRQSFIPPVIEAGIYTALDITDCGDGRYVYDFGTNMSGYVRLGVCQRAGDEIVIRYGEDFDGVNIVSPHAATHYPESEYQTDRFICSGKPKIWSPSFSYHGFRYIEVTGLDAPSPDAVRAVFIHQDIAQTGHFRCSDERLNRLFDIGIQACLSNFVCKVTDCPTREKLGWANDLQASAEQMLMNFDIAAYFRKHITDITDCMKDDGMMPGIVPTDVWGYTWGHGPVSEGLLFELCYQLYIYTGDSSELIGNIPYFLRSLDNFRSHEDESGFCAYGLTDWAPPVSSDIPVQFLNGALYINFLRITRLAASLAGDDALVSRMEREAEVYRRRFIGTYIREDGSCVYDSMTAPAMVIYYGLYEGPLGPLAGQLKRAVEAKAFHHDCGMVGLRRLYYALNKCGLEEYALRIITADGFPGYTDWLDRGATTLWETWDGGASHNHHMYSDFMSWMMKTLCGISPDPGHPGFERVIIKPYFAGTLTFCEGSMDTVKGRIALSWERRGDGYVIDLTIPGGCTGIYEGKEYTAGKYTLTAAAQP